MLDDIFKFPSAVLEPHQEVLHSEWLQVSLTTVTDVALSTKLIYKTQSFICDRAQIKTYEI